jgi:ferric-dicitrate binding protein FerR (iron transport regulator)
VILRTPDGTITPTGTRYKVQADISGTTVDVMEGNVRLSGNEIFRLSTPGRDAPKASPAKQLDVQAGD